VAMAGGQVPHLGPRQGLRHDRGGTTGWAETAHPNLDGQKVVTGLKYDETWSVVE
jgi:hypothetical protein